MTTQSGRRAKPRVRVNLHRRDHRKIGLRMGRQVLKYLAVIFGLIVVSAAAAYWHFFVTMVTVMNTSGKPLSAVEVRLGQNTIWHGDIASGISRRAFGVPDQNAFVEISYRFDEIDTVCRYDHATADLPSSDKITVKENGGADVVIKMLGHAEIGPSKIRCEYLMVHIN